LDVPRRSKSTKKSLRSPIRLLLPVMPAGSITFGGVSERRLHLASHHAEHRAHRLVLASIVSTKVKTIGFAALLADGGISGLGVGCKLLGLGKRLLEHDVSRLLLVAR